MNRYQKLMERMAASEKSLSMTPPESKSNTAVCHSWTMPGTAAPLKATLILCARFIWTISAKAQKW